MRNPLRTFRKRSQKPLSKNQQRKWHNLHKYEQDEIIQATKFLADWFTAFMTELKRQSASHRWTEAELLALKEVK